MSGFCGTPFTPVSASWLLNTGSKRRSEFELGARFEGSCGLALVLALSQMREHGLGPFGRADLHPRRKPLDWQGRFAPQPGSDGQLGGGAAQSLKSEVQGPKSKVGANLKESPVDLQPLTTIQQNNFTPQPPLACGPITLTLCVTPHPSSTSRQHYFHRTAPLYMERRIYFRSPFPGL